MRKLQLGIFVAVAALIFTSALPGALLASSKHLSVTMNALNSSGESGTATIKRASNGQLTVTINLTGEPSGASQPAHIHGGSCANLDPVPKVTLNPVVDGKSETTIPAPPSGSTGARSIVVHKGTGDDLKTYVACGDIVKP